MTPTRQRHMDLAVQLYGDLVDMQPLVIEQGFAGIGNGDVLGYGIGSGHDDLLGRARPRRPLTPAGGR